MIKFDIETSLSRLYRIEGTAFLAGGQAEVDAARFQRSLDLT
jgi:hypothetical protein